MDEPAYELHAGGRFIPGIGWLGLDPSHGIFTGNTHFPIASPRIRCQFRAVFEVVPLPINPTFNRKAEVGNNPLLIYTIRLNL
jgi:transglutaminase-like putative cysteine protease